jgi:hypothetical protein
MLQILFLNQIHSLLLVLKFSRGEEGWEEDGGRQEEEVAQPNI